MAASPNPVKAVKGKVRFVKAKTEKKLQQYITDLKIPNIIDAFIDYIEVIGEKHKRLEGLKDIIDARRPPSLKVAAIETYILAGRETGEPGLNVILRGLQRAKIRIIADELNSFIGNLNKLIEICKRVLVSIVAKNPGVEVALNQDESIFYKEIFESFSLPSTGGSVMVKDLINNYLIGLLNDIKNLTSNVSVSMIREFNQHLTAQQRLPEFVSPDPPIGLLIAHINLKRWYEKARKTMGEKTEKSLGFINELFTFQTSFEMFRKAFHNELVQEILTSHEYHEKLSKLDLKLKQGMQVFALLHYNHLLPEKTAIRICLLFTRKDTLLKKIEERGELIKKVEIDIVGCALGLKKEEEIKQYIERELERASKG